MLCFPSTYLTLLTALVTVSWAADTWMTTFELYFKLACPSGQTVRQLQSVYDYRHYDRVWNMTCARPAQWVDLTTCEWSGYQNDYDEVLIYQCPGDYILTGIESIFDRNKLDRMWSFQCCNPEDFVTHECMYTPYINTYTNLLNYRVPNDYVLRGVESVNDENKRDRIFKFDICKLAPVDYNNHVIVG